VHQERVLADVLSWARDEPNVRVVVLDGSLARDDGSIDEWSDLDLQLYVNDPAPLLEQRSWYEQFGEVLVVEALENLGWFPTRLVYYVDGKIDFMIAPAAVLRDAQEYDRPMRVLVDKDGISASIAGGPRTRVELPNAHAYHVCVNEFYAAALMEAKMLVRDEPIKAKIRDFDLKARLFEMIVWDHAARYGDERDVRPRGAEFRRWVDGDTESRLRDCWSDTSTQAAATALGASIDLFGTSSTRLAHALGFEPFANEAVLSEIGRILNGRVDDPDS
jgi:aminoglycoside 6-adenylyltransferase